MNEITFKDLRSISNSLKKGKEEVFVNYLNTFEGENIFEKFKTILTSWESDVSPSLNLNVGDKTIKISLQYILSEMSNDIGGEIEKIKDDVKIIFDIPKNFDILVQEDIIPIYSLIKYIEISGISINISDLLIYEKCSIIDNLPAKVYNILLSGIMDDKTKIIGFSNPVLDKFKFNFITNEPYIFLKGLFTNFTEDYFRNTVYFLSKKIDGELLINSTPIDIEYYSEMYSKEVQEQNNGLTI